MAADETTQSEKSSFWTIFRNNVCPPLNVKEDEDISTAQFDDISQSLGINHDEIYKSPAQVIEQPEVLKRPDETAQEGVQAMEAITLTWTKTSVGALYILYVGVLCSHSRNAAADIDASHTTACS